MNELIQKVTQVAGISEDQARKATQTVIDFIKSKLPSNLGGQLDSLIGSREPSEAGKGLGGMFTR